VAAERTKEWRVRRLLANRRRVRNLILVFSAALSLVLNVGCKPPPNGPQIAKNHAWIQLKQRGWTSQAQCLVDLWQAESGWNVFARNPSSGAYGIPQALPANQMRSAGKDWVHNPATQVRWGLSYIKKRYGGPCNAWRHFKQRHWYQQAAPSSTPSSAPSSAPSSVPSPAPPSAPTSGAATTSTPAPTAPSTRPTRASSVSN